MNEITAISLFSGAGGDTLGMINSGINVLGFIENNKDAINTHIKNFPKCKIIGQNIIDVEEKNLEAYMNIDIIFGGFPCQSFSHGGKKNPKDKRSFLYQEFVRIANIIKPKIIIGENVKGLLTRKDTDKKLFIERIMEDFDDIGYSMKYDIFNMKDYGLPQDRKRVIIYGIRKDLNIKFNLSCIETFPPKFNKDILEFSLENSHDVNKDYLLGKIKKEENICVSNMNNTEKTGKPPTNLVKCIEKDELSFKKRSKPTYGCIIDKNDVSRTILCTYSRMPRLFVSVKNKNKYYLRPYTIKELARIQGFPDNFVFTGTDISKITQIGNAIPPIFVSHIMNYIQGILSGDIIEI